MQKEKIKNKIQTIEEVNNGHSIIQENKSLLKGLFLTIFTSFRVGSFGFAVVLTLIIITKLLAYSTGTKEFFELNINDIVFALWGFIVLSFSKFISFQKK